MARLQDDRVELPANMYVRAKEQVAIRIECSADGPCELTSFAIIGPTGTIRTARNNSTIVFSVDKTQWQMLTFEPA